MSTRQYSKDPLTDRALRHSIRDGMAFSVQVGAGETYLSAFALFLRATAPQVALISTLPPLLGSLAQIVSAWVGSYVGRRRLVLAGVGLQAAIWIPIVLIPWLEPEYGVMALLALLILYQSAVSIAAPQWTSIMRDLVSERRRGRYFGHRTRLTTVTAFVSLVLGGLLLHEFDTAGRTYLGFVVIFLLAFAARAVSVYHLSFLHDNTGASSPPPDLHIEHWWRSLQSSGAIRFSTYFALMNLAVGVSSPFVTVYMLRDLALSYLEFTALSGTSVFVQFLMLTTWGRVADVYGNRLILLATSISLPAVPLFWLFSDNFWYLLLIQALSGLVWSGFTLGAGNLLFELVPQTRRAAYVAFHNIGAAAGVFAGAMIGAGLAVVLPPRDVLFGDGVVETNLLYLFAASGILRAVIAAMLARRVPEIRKPRRSLSPQALIMRITGISAMRGVLIEYIGRGSVDEPAPPDDGEASTRSDNPAETRAKL